jgi:hypothetical protein
MLNTARVPKEIREGVWAEAAQYATDIENMIVTANKPVSSVTLFYKENAPTIKALRIFGEMAVIEDSATRKMRAKLANRGKPCMFLGRAVNHTEDTYRFLNLQTNKVITSRNAIWLNQTYSEWNGITDVSITRLSTTNDEDDDEDEVEIKEPGRVPNAINATVQQQIHRIQEEQIRAIPPPATPTAVTPKFLREMRKLNVTYNPVAFPLSVHHGVRIQRLLPLLRKQTLMSSMTQLSLQRHQTLHRIQPIS